MPVGCLGVSLGVHTSMPRRRAMRQHQDRCEIARPATSNTCPSNAIGMWESQAGILLAACCDGAGVSRCFVGIDLFLPPEQYEDRDGACRRNAGQYP